MHRVRITHLIPGLGVGGAERMLQELVGRLDPEVFDCDVVSMTGLGEIGPELQGAGVEVTPLGMRPGVPDPRGLWKLVRHLRSRRTQVVQSWLYHADLMAAVAAPLAGGPPVVWGLHYSTASTIHVKPVTAIAAWLNARLSGFLPARIIACSHSAAAAAVELGYSKQAVEVIPNGIDTERFAPREKTGGALRGELGLPAKALLIGMVARWHPMKDHATFIEAARTLSRERPDVHYVLVGGGVDRDNRHLVDLVDVAGLGERVHLFGSRSDMSALQAVWDIATLSSAFGEALPLALVEAMSCGVPCVATDVGDCARLIGDTGTVVPPGDPSSLARAWGHLLSESPEERKGRGDLARERVMDAYDLRKMAEGYAAVYREVGAG